MAELSSDILTILLAHDTWGTRKLLELCRPLSHEQFHRRFDIGLGALHETLTHMVSTMRRWADRLENRPPRPALHRIVERPDIPTELADRSVDDLLKLLDDASRELAAIAAKWRAAPGGLGTIITLDWPGEGGKTKRHTFTRAAVLVHVCTHGMHHRAQVLNMLRHLNVPGLSDKLPDPCTVDWQAEVESPPVIV
ncbi:MAG: DinB family protein [Phycisphaerales bacterium]